MDDEALIEQTKAALKQRKIAHGDFWKIDRSRSSFTVVWFWRAAEGDPHNHSCQFDEEAGKLLWCY